MTSFQSLLLDMRLDYLGRKCCNLFSKDRLLFVNVYFFKVKSSSLFLCSAERNQFRAATPHHTPNDKVCYLLVYVSSEGHLSLRKQLYGQFVRTSLEGKMWDISNEIDCAKQTTTCDNEENKALIGSVNNSVVRELYSKICTNPGLLLVYFRPFHITIQL